MTVQDLADSGLFSILNEGDDMDREITKPFCCDLLSIAMGKAPAGCAWVTVMGNMNTLAVASLADAACIIMAEDVPLDAVASGKAKMQGITVFRTELPIFEAALAVYRKLGGFDADRPHADRDKTDGSPAENSL
ncbi:MAG: hypothetical protein Q4F29_07620 [Lachnospiraceae bacterium]|nr:hypothetical protein [Lachnospiraceae bacterium]